LIALSGLDALQPKYKTVVEALTTDIRSGQLKPGDRLPTHRQLAHQHGLSLGTATKVFAEMDAMGLTVGEVGRGTFVRMNADARAVEFALSTPGHKVVDFSRNHLVLPEQDAIFAAAVTSALGDDDCDVLDYRDNAGAEFDRLAIWRWLNDERSIQIGSHQDITICSGGQHALMIVLLAIAKPGQTIAVEHLTYPVIRLACDMLRLHVVEVASDEQGLCPDALEAACKKHDVAAVFCMPNVQNPTSVTLSEERRRAIVDVIERNRVFVLEDDAYGFLLEQPPVSLAALSPENVFYLRTLSKSWAPGLRVCYLASPEQCRGDVDRAQRASIWMGTPLMASVATQLINSGEYERVVQAKRKEVFKRQAIVRRVFGDLQVATDMKSMHVVLPLSSTTRTEWVMEALSDAGIKASPLSQFAASNARGKQSNGLRLCIGAPRERAVMADSLDRIRLIVKGLQ